MDMTTPPHPQAPEQHSGMARVVARNIKALIERRHQENRRKGRQDRIADAITRFTGSMTFVYLHLTIFAVWILINLGWLPLVEPFDPSFVVLAMVASVEAIFLSTFVLISQNRMNALADKRADLDLQVSLLSEHEITHLIQLVTAIAHRMGLEESRNPELHELARDVAPEKVLDEIELHEQQFSDNASGPAAGAEAAPQAGDRPGARNDAKNDAQNDATHDDDGRPPALSTAP
jgi:uncharacterized membrane protein